MGTLHDLIRGNPRKEPLKFRPRPPDDLRGLTVRVWEITQAKICLFATLFCEGKPIKGYLRTIDPFD
jgi:hypothetical protein